MHMAECCSFRSGQWAWLFIPQEQLVRLNFTHKCLERSDFYLPQLPFFRGTTRTVCVYTRRKEIWTPFLFLPKQSHSPPTWSFSTQCHRDFFYCSMWVCLVPFTMTSTLFAWRNHHLFNIGDLVFHSFSALKSIYLILLLKEQWSPTVLKEIGWLLVP